MIRRRISNRTKALVEINPNNPTGAVYDERSIREIGDIAAEYGIPLISDEIYDKIIMDGTHFSASQLSDDIPRIILNGFSKVNLMPGWRMGYMYFMDRDRLLDEVREGLMKQFRARICPNVPCQAAARASLQGPQDYIVDMNDKLRERADFTYRRLNEIPRISTRRGRGAFYMFPLVDLDGTPWRTDKDFVLDLIKTEGLVVVHGSGVDPEFGSGHFRTITLPPMEVLERPPGEVHDQARRASKPPPTPPARPRPFLKTVVWNLVAEKSRGALFRILKSRPKTGSVVSGVTETYEMLSGLIENNASEPSRLSTRSDLVTGSLSRFHAAYAASRSSKSLTMLVPSIMWMVSL